jgi:hypothetical protein
MPVTTCRSRVATFAADGGALESCKGISIFPDEVTTSSPAPRLLPQSIAATATGIASEAPQSIAARYGKHTADSAAKQLECSRQRSALRLAA